MDSNNKVKGLSLAAQCLLEVGKDFKVTQNSKKGFLRRIYCAIKGYFSYHKEDDKPKVTIRGAGILGVKSSDILKSKEGKRQLKALKELKELTNPTVEIFNKVVSRALSDKAMHYTLISDTLEEGSYFVVEKHSPWQIDRLQKDFYLYGFNLLWEGQEIFSDRLYFPIIELHFNDIYKEKY
jgi:hypothetical protein